MLKNILLIDCLLVKTVDLTNESLSIRLDRYLKQVLNAYLNEKWVERLDIQYINMVNVTLKCDLTIKITTPLYDKEDADTNYELLKQVIDYLFKCPIDESIYLTIEYLNYSLIEQYQST